MNFAIIVEGAHDASFLGQLLKARGFTAAKKLSEVPEDWKILFPKAFPMDGERLERVMRFPEIFIRDDQVVGITTSGSDSRLISTLRYNLDAMGVDAFSAIAIFIDADQTVPTERFANIQKQLNALNSAASAESEPGYPLCIPQQPGVIEPGEPSIGVFVFPDNEAQGALESILIACAEYNHVEIAEGAKSLVERLDTGCPLDQEDLKQFRAGMGKQKATVGTIANMLKPGVSVASSLAQTSWLHAPAMAHPHVRCSDAFLGAMLGQETK